MSGERGAPGTCGDHYKCEPPPIPAPRSGEDAKEPGARVKAGGR